MSGLGSFSTGGNATYLRIGMGKDDKERPRAIIGKRAKEGDPGAVQVFKADGNAAVDKEGNAVYRTEHAFIEGVVRKLERVRKEQNGGEQEVLQITIDAGVGNVFLLELDRPIANKEAGRRAYWEDFVLRMPNIDWSKPVKIQPYAIPQDDKPEYMNKFLVAYQGGTKVEKAKKITWLRDAQSAAEIEAAMPCYVHDSEENEWKYKKGWSWLDLHCVQPAIDKVAALNDGMAKEVAAEADEPVTALPAAAPITKTAMEAMLETATAIAEKNKNIPLPQIEDNDDGLPPLSF